MTVEQTHEQLFAEKFPKVEVHVNRIAALPIGASAAEREAVVKLVNLMSRDLGELFDLASQTKTEKDDDRAIQLRNKLVIGLKTQETKMGITDQKLSKYFLAKVALYKLRFLGKRSEIQADVAQSLTARLTTISGELKWLEKDAEAEVAIVTKEGLLTSSLPEAEGKLPGSTDLVGLLGKTKIEELSKFNSDGSVDFSSNFADSAFFSTLNKYASKTDYDVPLQDAEIAWLKEQDIKLAQEELSYQSDRPEVKKILGAIRKLRVIVQRVLHESMKVKKVDRALLRPSLVEAEQRHPEIMGELQMMLGDLSYEINQAEAFALVLQGGTLKPEDVETLRSISLKIHRKRSLYAFFKVEGRAIYGPDEKNKVIFMIEEMEEYVKWVDNLIVEAEKKGEGKDGKPEIAGETIELEPSFENYLPAFYQFFDLFKHTRLVGIIVAPVVSDWPERVQKAYSIYLDLELKLSSIAEKLDLSIPEQKLLKEKFDLERKLVDVAKAFYDYTFKKMDYEPYALKHDLSTIMNYVKPPVIADVMKEGGYKVDKFFLHVVRPIAHSLWAGNVSPNGVNYYYKNFFSGAHNTFFTTVMEIALSTDSSILTKYGVKTEDVAFANDFRLRYQNGEIPKIMPSIFDAFLKINNDIDDAYAQVAVGGSSKAHEFTYVKLPGSGKEVPLWEARHPFVAAAYLALNKGETYDPRIGNLALAAPHEFHDFCTGLNLPAEKVAILHQAVHEMEMFVDCFTDHRQVLGKVKRLALPSLAESILLHGNPSSKRYFEVDVPGYAWMFDQMWQPLGGGSFDLETVKTKFLDVVQNFYSQAKLSGGGIDMDDFIYASMPYMMRIFQTFEGNHVIDVGPVAQLYRKSKATFLGNPIINTTQAVYELRQRIFTVLKEGATALSYMPDWDETKSAAENKAWQKEAPLVFRQKFLDVHLGVKSKIEVTTNVLGDFKILPDAPTHLVRQNRRKHIEHYVRHHWEKFYKLGALGEQKIAQLWKEFVSIFDPDGLANLVHQPGVMHKVMSEDKEKKH